MPVTSFTPIRLGRLMPCLTIPFHCILLYCIFLQITSILLANETVLIGILLISITRINNNVSWNTFIFYIFYFFLFNIEILASELGDSYILNTSCASGLELFRLAFPILPALPVRLRLETCGTEHHSAQMLHSHPHRLPPAAHIRPTRRPLLAPCHPNSTYTSALLLAAAFPQIWGKKRESGCWRE